MVVNGRYIVSKSINLSPSYTSCTWVVLFPPRDEAPFVISDFGITEKVSLCLDIRLLTLCE